ncbi:MAG: FTR1 family protein [Rhodospirillales bacterium]|nr:FTR1 family protein [Rhodospirillales bacterium]
MLETLVITFREGLEMFLVVAITMAYLAKTGRQNLMTPAWAGVFVAVLISATTGWHIKDLAQDPLMEGVLAISAGVLVASLTVMIMVSAKNIGKSITDNLERKAIKGGYAAAFGIFVFVTLMVAREGMEMALMLGAMTSYQSLYTTVAGALLGFSMVGLIGLLWMSQSKNINLKLFMQVTGLFLVLFAVHLFILGVHELSEGSALPFIGADGNFAVHMATEVFDPNNPNIYAQIMSYSMLAVPCGWLGLSFIRDKIFSRPAMTAAE